MDHTAYTRVLIRDLVEAQSSDEATLPSSCYVHFYGTVTCKSPIKLNNKIHFQVDDGTGSIKCILELNISHFKTENDMLLTKYQPSDNPLLQAIFLTAVATNKKLKRIHHDEIDLGAYVSIVGKKNKYKGHNMVFIDTIEVANLAQVLHHMDTVNCRKDAAKT